MRKWIPISLLSLAAAAILSACAPAAALTQAPTTQPTTEATPAGRAIVLGDIGDDPAVIIQGTQPIADYLAAQLKDQGITHGEVRVAKDADEMAQFIKDGKVDLYFDSLYPAMLI